MKKEKKVNIKLDQTNMKKLIISIALVIALVIQFAFFSYLMKSLTSKDDGSEENILMKYTSNGSFDYKVYLKENEFIKSEYLEEGEAYILNLIDHININSSYNFKATENTKVSGNNKLLVRLKVYYRESSDISGNPEVLNRENVIKENIIDFEEMTYSTVNSFDLYLDDYLDVLKNFQNQVKISLEGYLEVVNVTEFNGNVGGATYNDDYSNTLKIPLSTSVIKLEESSKEKTSNVYTGDLVKTNKTVMSYIVIANVIVFLIICILLKQLFMFTNRSEYERVLNKILKSYDDIIVNVSTIVNVKDYKIIEIKEFKELLNLSRELLLPIMNYEVFKGEETWLYVIKDDMLYRYLISKKDLDEKKKVK